MLLLWSIWSSAAAHGESGPYFIHFNFHRVIETETESRYLRTDAQFNHRGFIQYKRDDEVIGSINAAATDHNDYYAYHRRSRNWYTAEGICRLIKGLAHRGFYELESGPRPERYEYPVKYFMSLMVRCGDNRQSVSYFSARDAAPAARSIELVQRYLKRRLQLLPVEKSRLTTDSDASSSLKIGIVKLLRNPKLYHGKRIRISDDFVYELENVSLSDRGIPQISLWVGSTPSTFGSVANLEPYSGARVAMEGIFVAGRRGHFGMWKGELKRVTKVERLE